MNKPDLLKAAEYAIGVIDALSQLKIEFIPNEQGNFIKVDAQAHRTEENQHGVFQWPLEPDPNEKGHFTHYGSGESGTIMEMLCGIAATYAMDNIENGDRSDLKLIIEVPAHQLSVPSSSSQIFNLIGGADLSNPESAANYLFHADEYEPPKFKARWSRPPIDADIFKS